MNEESVNPGPGPRLPAAKSGRGLTVAVGPLRFLLVLALTLSRLPLACAADTGAESAAADGAVTDLQSMIVRSGPRLLVGSALLAWGLFSPGLPDEAGIRLPAGEPAPLVASLDTAGTIAAGATLGTFALAHLRDDPGNPLEGISMSAAVIGAAYATRTYMKSVFSRERPWSAIDGTRSEARDDSFPSGHSLVSWACVGEILVSTLRRDRPPGMLLLVTAEALTVSVLRVAAGEHYPGDVIAGAVVGLAVGIAVGSMALTW